MIVISLGVFRSVQKSNYLRLLIFRRSKQMSAGIVQAVCTDVSIEPAAPPPRRKRLSTEKTMWMLEQNG